MTADAVSREIIPYATEWDRAEQVDLAIVARLGAFGMTIPTEYGGIGGDHLSPAHASHRIPQSEK